MFEEIRKELQGKSDQAIYLYLKSIDLSSVIQYLKENSTYNDISEKRKFKLIQDLLKGRSNICPVCGKIIEHNRKNCSMKCRDLNPEIQKKIRETNIRKYGTEYPMQSKDVQEKYKNTCLVKYDVDNPMQSKEVQAKYKETCMKKFGVKSNLLTSEFKEKSKETSLKKIWYRIRFAK